MNKTNYPAIDGIAKPERDLFEGAEGIIYCQSEEDPIRKDVQVILDMDEITFWGWYWERYQATIDMLRQSKLIGSVPQLNYGAKIHAGYNFVNTSHVMSGKINLLEYILEHLNAIKDKWQSLHITTDNP